MKRIYAIFVALILVFSLCVSVSADDQAQSEYSTEANSGVRHEICTTLEGTRVDDYYTGSYSYDTLISLESDALLASLRKLMTDTHTTESSYADCRDMAVLTDCENGDGTSISLIYTSYSSCWAEWCNNMSGGWNREHVWPQSLGGFSTGGAGADLHHVRPVDSTVNSTRGNMKFGNVSGGTAVYGTSVTNRALGGYRSTPYFEPLDNVKGDIARIILYMYVRYGGDSRYTCQSVTTVFESVDVLLEWCALDPVDTWEMGRNEVVAAYQGNRNVFIDYPELAWLIFDEQIPVPMTTPSGIYTHPYEAVITAPTCTEQGYTTYTCPDCADVFIASYVAPLGHSYEDDICTVCGEEKPDDVYVHIYYPAGNCYMTSNVTSSNTMSSGTLDEAAIWTIQTNENGYISFLHNNQYLTSGETGRSLELTGTFTDYALWEIETAEDGVYLRNVAAVYNETAPQYMEYYANAFTTYGFNSSSAAIYTFQLIQIPVCEVNGHRYESVVTDPTCTESGFTTYTCKKCDDSYISDHTDPIPHDGNMGEHCAVCNAYINVTGTCGSSLTWLITQEGNLTISGVGLMDDYDSSENVAPWFAYRNSISSVTIDPGVVNIGEYAFYACLNIEQVDLGNVINSIGDGAFMDCTQLKSITIPDSCVVINNFTFSGCADLTEVTIPETVTQIGYQAFQNCSSLASVQLPTTVTTLGANAFYNCSALTSIVLPNGITNIDYSTFYGCSSLSSITLPENLTTIESSAFQGCSSLTGISIPDTVTTIGASAFRGCASLTEVNLPSILAKVEDYLFYGCSKLESVTLHQGLISIGDSSFRNCVKLKNIHIPEGVITIDRFAFARCTELQSVVIPSSIMSIGEYGFYLCMRLSDVYYVGSNEQWSNITIGTDNDPLSAAIFHYNYVDPNTCEHSYESVITPPTYTEQGYTTYTCAICGHSYIDSLTDCLVRNGWIKEENKWYYYTDNVKQTGWIKDNGKWYYLNTEGIMQSGWIKINDVWYYLDNSMVTGWYKINNLWYYFNSNGAMQSGWEKIGGTWYNLDNAMVTGWYKINNLWYYFNANGAMQSGWEKIGGTWYYLDNAMVTGWYKIDNLWYYFNSNGAMQTGWKLVNNYWYYLRSNGSMHTGWLNLNGTWYYCDTNGRMVTGTVEIDGKIYYFNQNGVWIK